MDDDAVRVKLRRKVGAVSAWSDNGGRERRDAGDDDGRIASDQSPAKRGAQRAGP